MTWKIRCSGHGQWVELLVSGELPSIASEIAARLAGLPVEKIEPYGLGQPDQKTFITACGHE